MFRNPIHDTRKAPKSWSAHIVLYLIFAMVGSQLMVSGCSGDDDGSNRDPIDNPGQNTPRIISVNASDSDIEVGDEVTLWVEATDVESIDLDYYWTQLEGPTATIANPSQASTAVAGFDIAGTYVFQVRVTDEDGLQTTGEVTVTAKESLTSARLEASIRLAANATISADTVITVDPRDEDDGIEKVLIAIRGENGFAASTPFDLEAPYDFDLGRALYDGDGTQIVLEPGAYEMRAKVLNGADAEDPNHENIWTNWISFTVADDSPPENKAPIIISAAEASPATVVATVTTTQLSVVAEDPDGDALTYEWTVVNGPGTVSLVEGNKARTETSVFSAAGSYTLMVTVRDATHEITSEVVVSVNPNELPEIEPVIRNVLIVYITSSDSSPANTPSPTVESIKGALLTNELNFNEQLQSATYGKYQLSLGGVEYVEIELSTEGIEKGYASGAAEDKLINELGYQKIADGNVEKFRRPASHEEGQLDFDHVMFFVPRNVAQFSGQAIKFSYYSVYRSAHPSIFAHEMGHNFGLGHSGSPTSGYGDYTCFMGRGSYGPLRSLNAVKKLRLGLFDLFPGSHITSEEDGRYEVYPIAEIPKLLADDLCELKVIEIPITNKAAIDQAIADKTAPGITVSNMKMLYTISYIKKYALNDGESASPEFETLSKYATTDSFNDRTVLVHKNLAYDFDNGTGLYFVDDSTYLAKLDMTDSEYTISEGSAEFQIRLVELSPDASFGHDFAVVTVDNLKD